MPRTQADRGRRAQLEHRRRADAVGVGRAPNQGGGGCGQRRRQAKQPRAQPEVQRVGRSAVAGRRWCRPWVKVKASGGGVELMAEVGGCNGCGQTEVDGRRRWQWCMAQAQASVALLPCRDEIFLPYPFDLGRGVGISYTDVWDPRSHIQ
jgi:hypothetical protein